jgi:hypothetical protein
LVIGNAWEDSIHLYQQDHSKMRVFYTEELVFQYPDEFGIIQVNNEKIILASLI